MDIELIKSDVDNILSRYLSDTSTEKNQTKDVLASRGRILKELEGLQLDGGISDISEDIVTTGSIRDTFIERMRNPGIQAESTYIPLLDKIWRWRRREFTMWTGYAGDGKSEFFNFVTLIKILNDPDAKACFFSPENYPAEDFYKAFMRMIISYDPEKAEDDLLYEAMDRIKDRIIFVYPSNADFTIKNIERLFRQMIEQEGVTICCLDPYAKISHQYSGMQEHHYVASFMMERIAFARRWDISYNMIAHQVTPQVIISGEREGLYPAPDGYRVKGGGTFKDSTDNMITVFRPSMPTKPQDTTMKIRSVKIKKQREVATPGEITVEYDRESGRYYGIPEYGGKIDFFNGKTPF